MSLKLQSAFALFRTRLDIRLAVLFTLVALIPLLLVAWMSYPQARFSLINLALSKMEQEAVLTAKDMSTYLEQFSADLLMVSSVPPVQGLLRAQDNGGLDPATGRSYEEWIDWLRQLFASIAQGKKFYRSLSYLDEAGNELVRIDYKDDLVVVASADTRLLTATPLQNRANEAYFTEAKALQLGQVYISPLHLNQEENLFEDQPVPIIYFSTPIYDRADQFRGVVVSTVYAASFLNRLNVSRGQIYLADQDGFYLAHPDPTHTFGAERKAGYNVAADFANPYEALLNSGNESYTTLDDQRAEVVALHKFRFDPLHPERSWLLIRTLPQDEVLGPVKALGILTAGVALLVTLVVGHLARRLAATFTRPIVQLTQVANQISQQELPQLVDSLGRVAAGEPTAQFDLSIEPVEVRWADEVGQLGLAFNRMAASLHQAQPRLLTMQEQLRLQKEAAEAANQAKSVFLANMSHELRTPLNAILGYAQILQQRADPHSPLSEGLATIHQSGHHLLTLINDILDLSKVEAGKLELQPAPIHLPTFLANIVVIIRTRAEAKRLPVWLDQDETLPAWVEVDETRLRQVLLNLLGNAVKFTAVGQVTLRVESKGREQPTDTHLPLPDALRFRPYSLLRFEVIDTGPGISLIDQQRIFQPFEQVGELARRAEGTGLGLSISRRLVRLMGGELHVESPASTPAPLRLRSGRVEGATQEGPGSRFWFEVTLPLPKPVTVEPIATEAAERIITGYKGPRRTILVVDDIASNRAVIVDLLHPLDFEVIEAENGRQGLELAQQRQPDLIIMDQRMPELNGLAAAQQLRRIPPLQHVPLISMSASVSEADQALSREAGYDAFLAKPIHWPQLAALLKAYLHLEWTYAKAVDEATLASTEPLLPPPPAELAALYELARLGNMRRIRDKAADLETLGEPYVPFARKLRELAQGYQEKAILALVEQYLESGGE